MNIDYKSIKKILTDKILNSNIQGTLTPNYHTIQKKDGRYHIDATYKLPHSSGTVHFDFSAEEIEAELIKL